MSFDAQMRIGSLEILAALVFFGVVAVRLQPAATPVRRLSRVRLHLNVRDAATGGSRELTITVGSGEDAPIIGRSSGAQIGLLDPEVSRRHARFEVDRGVVYLSDLGSSNGTFLNGKRLGSEGIEVRAGDDIDVGNTRVSITEAEPVAWM